MASPAFGLKSKTKMLPLSNIPTAAGLEFLEAELFIVPDLPFAIVSYAIDGVRSEDGLRVDLDKQIFLDHFEDPAREDCAQQAAPIVLDQIFTFFESQPNS